MIGLVIPLLPYCQPKVSRRVKLEECGDFAAVEDMIGVLIGTLRKAPDLAEVPPINDDNEICTYAASAKLPYKICPEIDTEELVYVVVQEKSITEELANMKTLFGKTVYSPLWKDRVQAFKSWYKPAWLTKGKRSWDDNAQARGSGYAQGSASGSGYAQGWNGSSKRAYSAPATRPSKDSTELERNTDLVETPLDWYQLTPANLNESFLFPETENSKCSINKKIRKHTNDENAEYMLWIQSLIPNVDKKDERVYCPFCDMKNHLRWTCSNLDQRCAQHERHTCTLCIGNHPPFTGAIKDQES